MAFSRIETVQRLFQVQTNQVRLLQICWWVGGMPLFEWVETYADYESTGADSAYFHGFVPTQRPRANTNAIDWLECVGITRGPNPSSPHHNFLQCFWLEFMVRNFSTKADVRCGEPLSYGVAECHLLPRWQTLCMSCVRKECKRIRQRLPSTMTFMTATYCHWHFACRCCVSHFYGIPVVYILLIGMRRAHYSPTLYNTTSIRT